MSTASLLIRSVCFPTHIFIGRTARFNECLPHSGHAARSAAQPLVRIACIQNRALSGRAALLCQCLGEVVQLTKDSDLAHRSPGFVEVTCPDHRMYKQWSLSEYLRAGATIRASGQRVRDGTMSKARFEDLEKMLGMRDNPHGLLADVELCTLVRPLETGRYDWVHNLLQGGVLVAEAEAILAASDAAGQCSREELRQTLADKNWHFSSHNRAKTKGLHHVFDPRRTADDNPTRIKASCQEMLGLYGLLRFFFCVKLEGVSDLANELQSFKALCKVLDLLLAAKSRTVNVVEAASSLQTAVNDHLRLHQVAYGSTRLRPKHHWMQDVPQQVLVDGMVVDAFVVERIHLRIKAVAEKTRNTRAYERSVLSSSLTAHLNALEAHEVGDRLVGRRAALPGVAGAIVADRMTVYGVDFEVGDVVLCGDAFAGTLTACLLQAGELFAVVHPLYKVEDVVCHASLYKARDGDDFVVSRASNLVHALAWRDRPGGVRLVVRR